MSDRTVLSVYIPRALKDQIEAAGLPVTGSMVRQLTERGLSRPSQGDALRTLFREVLREELADAGIAYRTKTGRILTGAEVDQYAAEAEAGYQVTGT